MKTWIFVLLASLYVWHNGHAVKHLLFERSFPAAYYAHGNASNCIVKTAPDLKFCEDATVWDIHDRNSSFAQQKVLISCDPNRKSWNTVLGPLRDPEPRGSLWLLEDGEPRRLELQGYPAGHDFHPLGVAISPSYGNVSTLYVVNHAGKRSFVEQFTLSPFGIAATYVRTLSSPYFVSPNGISLTSPHSFYVSNDHFITRRMPYLGHILPLIETLLCLPLSWVSHVSLDPDPNAPEAITAHTFSAPFIPFSNGVSISPCGTKVAVASTSVCKVRIYSRNPATNALKHVRTVPVPFHPDNLEFDTTGALLVAGHPYFISLLKVKADLGGTAVAPSWAVSISEDLQVDTVFQSNGSFFSSSTTSVRTKSGDLYVTGLYTDGILVCHPDVSGSSA